MKIVTFKRLRLLGYIVAIATMLTMAITLFGVMMFGSAVIITPFGEATLELALIIFGIGTIGYVAVWDLFDRKITKSKMLFFHRKINKLTVLIFFIGFLCYNIAFFTTNYSLVTYPDCVYEVNPHMEQNFIEHGFFWSYLHVSVYYTGLTALLYGIFNILSSKCGKHNNSIIMFVLLAISVLVMSMFMYNAYSDVSVLFNVMSYC